MKLRPELILDILNIGHATSMRGEGISLREALARCNYRHVREHLDRKDLIPLLHANPDLIQQWLAYCEDKRTSGGCWVSEETCEVGSLESTEPSLKCDSVADAVAEFVIRELDSWSAAGDTLNSRCADWNKRENGEVPSSGEKQRGT